MRNTILALVFAGMMALASSGSGQGESHPQVAAGRSPSMPAAGGDTLSVMTYNVEGLPWPVARGRGEMLDRIGARLRALRQDRRQPHIVLLQEAFSADAAALAQSAGYPYAATGPDTGLRTPLRPDGEDAAFLDQARWDKGEQMGKQVGSGLMILSDYPIVGVDRMAFPDFACAGYDCLANKGVLIAQVAVPGSGVISVVDTHLNSRAAAGVPVARSQRAYARQIVLMTQYVRQRVPQDQPLIVGGDMNLGHDARRLGYFFDGFSRLGMRFVSMPLSGTHQALARLRQGDDRAPGDLVRATRHAKDWIFARDGAGAPLHVVGADVPFGSEGGGEPLSDHMGYVIQYAAPARPALGEPVRMASNDVRLPRGRK